MARIDFAPFEEKESVNRSLPHGIPGLDFAAGTHADGHDAREAVGLFSRRARIRWYCIFVLGIFLLFFARIAMLQIVRGAEYAAVADQNRVRIRVDRASRGIIVDRKGREIVKNVPEFILMVTPSELPREAAVREQVVATVAAMIHEPSLALIEEVTALPNDPYIREQALPLREHVAYETALALFAAEDRLAGFRVDIREERSYPEQFVGANGEATPMPESIAHIVGYLGKMNPEQWQQRREDGYILSDLVGKGGVEQSYDALLHGQHGRRYIETDALGREKSVVARTEPIAGGVLRLTIDLSLQRILEDELRAAIAKLPERTRTGAVGVAMEAHTGAIRALVSLPSFDPRVFSTAPSAEAVQALLQNPHEPLFSRAVSGEYPSGSTIKPLFALAALDEGIITPETTILSTGGIRVGQWFFPDWRAGGHGATTVRTALADSVNTFFYAIGGGYAGVTGLGIDAMQQWLQRFGIGATLGVDLPREGTGLVPSPEWKERVKNEQWYIGDTYHVAIGQGDVLVTPLQIAAMTATFANGGTLWRPHIVETGDDPVAINDAVASDENIRVVREGLRMGVTSGSSAQLSLLPFTAAGKTGTAQWSSSRPPHAWFTGWAPYEQPELVLTILLEEGEEGSRTAVPVARRVFERYLSP